MSDAEQLCPRGLEGLDDCKPGECEIKRLEKAGSVRILDKFVPMLNNKDETLWQIITIPEHEILYIPAEDLNRHFITYDSKGNTPPPQGVEASKIQCKKTGGWYRFARFHPADMVANHMVALEVIVQDIGHDGPFSNMSISYRVDSQASDHQDPIEQRISLVDKCKDNLRPGKVELLIHDGLNRTKESTMAPDEQKTDLTAEEDNAKRLADSWPEIRQAVIYFYLNASGQMDLDKAKRVIAKARGD